MSQIHNHLTEEEIGNCLVIEMPIFDDVATVIQNETKLTISLEGSLLVLANITTDCFYNHADFENHGYLVMEEESIND